MNTVERLTIYIGESDHWHDGKPLYMALIEQARQQGIIGATVTRGVAGFGKRRHGRINTTRMFELASDLPMVVTIIDTPQAIEAFLPLVQTMVHDRLVTRETVNIITTATAINPTLA